MIRQIIETTDGKYIGTVFDDKDPFISPDGITFRPDKIQHFDEGYVRYSNSHYSVLTKEVTSG